MDSHHLRHHKNSDLIVNTILAKKELYFMALPGLLIILVFTYIPIFGWYMAFSNYQLGKSIWDAQFIGLKYFKEFFIDSTEALSVIRNTLVMNISTLVLSLFSALAFAILLQELRNHRFMKVIQTVSFFPYFMSWVILYAVIYSLISVTNGAFNTTLLKLGWISEAKNILGDSRYSWLLIICVNIWNGLGYNSVIFISAIAGIGSEQYESAQIDGANRFQKILYITVPNLVPTLVVLLIINTGYVFNSGLDQYFIFTNTLNISTMEVLDYYIYRYGMKLMNYSYATAAGIIKTFISIILIFIVNGLAKKYSDKSIF
ncbi:MAG: ABC transporter permease subunit [Clostridiaceae bacterium]|nr:ABC transporter permease subunit [Clostridiaceae bacterium]